jgi:predicted metal-dependent peptidase
MKNIEKAINLLLNTKPFYAHFFLNSKIVKDYPGVPTAAAAVTHESTVLIFNSEFISKLKDTELAAVVEHEILHLLFDHVYAMKFDKDLNKHIANIAMDLAINQYIEGLPKEAIDLDMINKTTGLDLPPKETWEYYYYKLLQAQEKLEKIFPIDEHGTAIDGQVKGKGEGKEILADNVSKSIKNSAGNVPEVIAKVFDSLRSTSKVPWQQVLANFVASCSSSTTVGTRKKTNRRFGTDHPGKKKKRELVLGVCVDSSGSVSDESYEQFLSEIVRITKFCQKVYMVEADCVVQNIETLKKNTKKSLKRNGHGGTAYQPAISKCVELGCDAILYLGDLDASDRPQNPGKPFLWVAVGNSEPPGDFGKVIRL